MTQFVIFVVITAFLRLFVFNGKHKDPPKDS